MNLVKLHDKKLKYKKSYETINIGEGVKKRETSCTIGGNVN